MNNRFHWLALLFTICLLIGNQTAWGDEVDKRVAELKSSDPKVREAAAIALCYTEDVRVVVPLIESLRDVNSEVRASAAHALGEMKDARAVMPLAAALKDSEAKVRACAAGAIWEIRSDDRRVIEPLAAAVNDSDVSVRRAAAYALAKFKDARAVKPLVEHFLDENTGNEMRSWAAMALGFIGAPAVEPLILALKHKNKEVRDMAVMALGMTKDKRAIEPLEALLKVHGCNEPDAAAVIAAIKEGKAIMPGGEKK